MEFSKVILLASVVLAVLLESREADLFKDIAVGNRLVEGSGSGSEVTDYLLQVNQIRVVPMEGKTFGADVYGFHPDAFLKNGMVAERVKTALDKHLVLVFHNVSKDISPEKHLQIGRGFGTVDSKVSAPPKYLEQGKFNSPDQVKRALSKGAKLDELGRTMLKHNSNPDFPQEVTRIVKEPRDLIAFGEGWHSDLTFLNRPPAYAFLKSVVLPERGGNTWFSDMRAAYNILPEETKVELSHVTANHTDGHDSWTTHPTVRTDGRGKSLYVNKAFTRHFVKDGEVYDKPELLDQVLGFVDEIPEKHPEAFLNISWSEGQMVAWSNGYVQHSAQNDYTTLREMHRVVITGPTPL